MQRYLTTTDKMQYRRMAMFCDLFFGKKNDGGTVENADWPPAEGTLTRLEVGQGIVLFH